MSSGFYFMLYQSMSIKLLIILLTLVGIACSYQTLIIYLACTFVPSNISGIYLPWLFLQIIASGVYVAKKAWSLNKKLIDDKANIVFFKTKQQDTVLSKTLLALYIRNNHSVFSYILYCIKFFGLCKDDLKDLSFQSL